MRNDLVHHQLEALVDILHLHCIVRDLLRTELEIETMVDRATDGGLVRPFTIAEFDVVIVGNKDAGEPERQSCREAFGGSTLFRDIVDHDRKYVASLDGQVADRADDAAGLELLSDDRQRKLYCLGIGYAISLKFQ